MTVCCPECYAPVDVPRNAREGRCSDCRPQRRHSDPRPSKDLQQFISEHNSQARRA
jgi:hypothetical protein